MLSWLDETKPKVFFYYYCFVFVEWGYTELSLRFFTTVEFIPLVNFLYLPLIHFPLRLLYAMYLNLLLLQCFVSYVRSVYLMKDKEVFDVSRLPIPEYAL